MRLSLYVYKKILRKVCLSFLINLTLISSIHSSVIFENIDNDINHLSQKIISLYDKEQINKDQKKSIDKKLNKNNNELIAKKEQLIQEKSIKKAKVKAYRIISREKPNIKSKQVNIYRENRILDIEDIITNDTGTKWAKLANKDEYISAKWLELNNDSIEEENTFKDEKITEESLNDSYLKNSVNYSNENVKLQEIKNDNDLSKEDQELSNNIMKVAKAVGAIYGSENSESRKEIIENMASSYLNFKANELARAYINSLNTSVNTDFSFNYNKRSGFSGNAKALLPIVSEDNPKISYFLQSGIFANDRIIGHFGGGMRYYPNALALNDLGNMMFGLNLVYDHDFSRNHKRMSVGTQALINTLAFNANVYYRLSNWIGSYDFEKDYVQERPAMGWDAKMKYTFPSLVNVSLYAKMGQWYGDKVGIFGANSIEDLEKNPLIYEGGISYSPFPALNFTLNHSRSDKSSKKNTSINTNINIPFDQKAMKLAFEPKLAGISNTIEGSRTQFIDRDYSMVLEYRATPNKYHISYCGDLGNDRHCILLKNGFGEVIKNASMRVTPKHSCVLFEKGFNYITDNSGKVYVQITQSCTPKTDLHVLAGDVSAIFAISIEKLDFKISSSPKKIERFEESIITLAGGILANNLKVIWKLIGKGELIKTNTLDTTDSNGNATIKYKADGTMKDKEEVEVVASVNGVEFKAPVQIMVFGDNDLSIDKKVIGNKEIALVTYKNLRPNKTNVKWRLEGEDKALFLLESKDSTAKELQLIADEKGQSQVKIIGLDANGKVRIFAKNTDDELVSEKSKELEVKNYKATMILPTHNHPVTNALFENGTIDYMNEFLVKLTGLMPGTKVEFVIKDRNNGNKIASKEEIADEEGQSQVIFEAIKDYGIKNLEISAIYNQSRVNKIEVKDTIKLYQYVLKMNSQKEYLDAYKNNLRARSLILDNTEITVSGGKPNESVQWSVSGDGILSNQDLVFDQNGEAKALLTSKTPFKTPIEIVALGVGQDSTKTISYKLKTFTPSIEYPSLTNIYGKFDNTIDYNTDYSIKIKGLLANSIIEPITNTVIKPKEHTIKVDNKGEAIITYHKISDFRTKNIKPQFKYIKSGDTKEIFTMKDIAIKEYPLKLIASKEEIDAYKNQNSEELIRDFSIITVSGGKPNESVQWSVSGDGILSEEQKIFNSEGRARAKLNSKAPYTTNPIVEAQSMNKNSTKTISYKLRTFTPSIEYPSLTNIYGKFDNTIDYNTDYSIKIKGLLANSIIEPITNTVIKPKEHTIKVDNKGEAIITYHKISDFRTKNIKPQFKYIKSGDTKEIFTMKDIAIKEYPLKLIASKEEIDAYKNQNSEELIRDFSIITVSGGKPNESVQWSVSGDGILSEEQKIFNSEGRARAKLNSKAPYTTNPIVEAQSMNKNSTKTISYKLRTFTPSIEYPSLTNIYGKFDNTIDYNTDYSIKIKGLLANSIIEPITNTVIKPKNNTIKVDNKGEAIITYHKISDFRTKNIKPQFKYIKSGDTKEIFTMKELNLHQYRLNILSNKTELVGDETFQVTVSGGKPNESVQWSVSGDVKISSKDSKFNSKGEAYLNGQGKSPFNKSINVKAKSLNSTTRNEKIRIKYSILLAKGSYDSGILLKYYTYSPKYTLKFNIPEILNKIDNYKLVLQFRGYVDDYLNIDLNDERIVSKHPGGWRTCKNYKDITCSPILSPLNISLNNKKLKPMDNTISFQAENFTLVPGQVWLKLDEVKVEASWITK